MNDDEINEVQDACRRIGLPLPDRTLLAQRKWRDVLASEWGNWSSYRWPLFGILSDYWSKDEYPDALRFLWTHSEGDMDDAQFESVFGRHNLTPADLMTAEEQRALVALEDPITVYRGCTDATKHGRSWTLSEPVAVRFARERGKREAPDGKGLLLTGRCAKENIICYLKDDMGEAEVLARSNSVDVEDQVVI